MPGANVLVENARRVFAQHRGMLRTGAAIRLGIHPRTLYTLRDHVQRQNGSGITDHVWRMEELIAV